jgi:hypothetical protein
MTDRLSLRAWLPGLLVITAALFAVGIYLERGVIASPEPAVVQPEPSARVEGSGGEAGEAAPTNAPAGSGETTAEHAAESWPLGIDLESPLLIGGAIVVSLALAFAVLRSVNPIIPMAIVGFSILFAVLDLLELSHQLGASRTGLAALAVLLAVLHIAAALIAARLVMNDRRAALTTA